MKIRDLLRKAVPAGLVLVSVAVSLLFGELLARLAVNPGDFLFATLIADPILGHRIAPYTTGHDALGFRNPAVPERTRVIAIGDSQTYGVSAARGDSWPYQLGGLLGEPVYNMALGGYGPLEYLHLAGNDAKKLGARVLLVGFYFGNDLMDAYSAAHERPYWRDWGATLSADPGDFKDQRPGSGEREKRFGALRDWLSRHSVLYSLLRVTLLSRLALSEKDRMAAQTTTDHMMLWADPTAPSVRTIFSPQLRLAALDPQLPRVQEGLRITKQAFAALKTLADAQGVRLVLILIPTKERVYCRYLKESGQQMPNAFVSLCGAEERIKTDLIKFLTTEKIPYVDVTGAMEERISEHVQIYPMDSDGHPRAGGYGAIARAAFNAVHSQPQEK